MKLEGFFSKVSISCRIYDKFCLVDFEYPVSIPSKSHTAVAALLTRINFDIRIGKFILTMSTGELFYRAAILCPGIVPAYDSIKLTFEYSSSCMNHFGDDIARVAIGSSIPASAPLSGVPANAASVPTAKSAE